MYYPMNEQNGGCPGTCCRLYNAALGFLGALILAVVGLILGANFATTLFTAIPILIAAAVILAIIFIVTLLTKGCCQTRND